MSDGDMHTKESNAGVGMGHWGDGAWPVPGTWCIVNISFFSLFPSMCFLSTPLFNLVCTLLKSAYMETFRKEGS